MHSAPPGLSLTPLLTSVMSSAKLVAGSQGGEFSSMLRRYTSALYGMASIDNTE